MSDDEKLKHTADMLNESAQASVSMGLPAGCMKVIAEQGILVKELRKLDTLKENNVVKKGQKCWIDFENKETTNGVI